MNFLKRMGSASSSVRSVSIDQKSETSSDSKRQISSAKDKELKRLNEQLVNLEVLLEQVKNENGGYKNSIDQLTKQLGNAESENERLVEQKKLLEEQLEEIEHSFGSNLDVSESLKIKDTEVSKLLIELQSSQDSLKSLKQKYKAKLQSIKASHSKTLQEQSLKVFELKDEITLLKQENEELQDKLEEAGGADGESAGRKCSTSDSRSHIIIELSTQISEQEYQIASLESKLEEKDQLIAELQSAKLSPRDAQSLIEIEAVKTTQEMQSLTKELKMLKRQKRKEKSAKEKVVGNSDYLREVSTLSRDSGALDLSSPKRSDDADLDNADPYTLYASNHSFSSSSTLVT